MEATWTVPKNIRQIGEAHAHYAVYIEDYVATYIKQVIRLSDGGIRQGALVGKVYPDGEKTTFVIQGIVTDKEIYRTREQLFSPRGRETLRDQCEKFFAEMDVIGEVIFDSGKEDMDTVRRGMPAGNAGVPGVFLHVDCADCAQEFFIGSQGAVEVVESYYIYYERNEAMQNYLIAYNEETRRKVEEVHDIISGQARAAMGEFRMPRARMQKDTLLICTTCALLICISLLGIININQYQKMCKLEKSFNTVMASLGFGEEDAVVASSDAVSTNGTVSDDGVSDITPENGLAAEDSQGGLFDGLPIYISDATKENGENASGQNGNADESNASGQDMSGSEGNVSGGNIAGQDMNGSGGSVQGENTAGGGDDAEGQNTGGNGVTGQNADGGYGAEANASGQGENGNGGGASGQGENGSTQDPGGSVSGQENGDDAATMGGAGENTSGVYREYTIRRGDTLTSISMHFYQNRTMIGQICTLNGIKDPDNIIAGQKILLP